MDLELRPPRDADPGAPTLTTKPRKKDRQERKKERKLHVLGAKAEINYVQISICKSTSQEILEMLASQGKA